MTMDVTSRRTTEIKSEIQLTNCEETSAKVAVKRSFDVAFLMLPDEKLKQKQRKSEELILLQQQQQQQQQHDSERDVEIVDNFTAKKSELQRIKNHARYLQSALQKHQIFDDPKSIKLTYQNESSQFSHHQIDAIQKSAFTKVGSKESRTSPSLSASPDLAYQASLSPSPPIVNRNYHHHQTLLSPNSQVFKTHAATYQNAASAVSFVQDSFPTVPPGLSLETNPFLSSSKTVSQVSPQGLIPAEFAVKMRPVLNQYRPHDLSAYASNYPPFHHPHHQTPTSNNHHHQSLPAELKFPPHHHHHHHHQDISRNPAAAALLSTLLPPSLAALSLPAQNVCAKCNISFRMTSDLVYHMRSHHKNDAFDTTRKRREEKLKCPVCSESFRERHHLTRHMTAHQDKDEDDDDGTTPSGTTVTARQKKGSKSFSSVSGEFK